MWDLMRDGFFIQIHRFCFQSFDALGGIGHQASQLQPGIFQLCGGSLEFCAGHRDIGAAGCPQTGGGHRTGSSGACIRGTSSAFRRNLARIHSLRWQREFVRPAQYCQDRELGLGDRDFGPEDHLLQEIPQRIKLAGLTVQIKCQLAAVVVTRIIAGHRDIHGVQDAPLGI